MNNAHQLLRDANIAPTGDVIAEALGTANAAYLKFIEELQQQGSSLMEWRFYNAGKAWLTKGEYKWTTAKGTNKVKPIFWLSIWAGHSECLSTLPKRQEFWYASGAEVPASCNFRREI